MGQLIIFSGLGADHTVFSKLSFTGWEVHHIPWITPLKEEPLKNYISRMSIPEIKENAVVMGLSFGGLLAMELAEMKGIKKVILLSSLYSRNYLPMYLKMVHLLKMNHWFPLKIARRPTKLAYWFFGLSDPNDKAILKQLIGRTPEDYFIWATDCIFNYKGSNIKEGIVHIHGDNDRVLPMGSMHCDFVIKNGGHFIVLTHYKEVQKILENILSVP